MTHGFRIKSGMTNKNNVVPQPAQRHAGPDPASMRRRRPPDAAQFFADGEAALTHGFRIKSGMTNKNNVVSQPAQRHAGLDPASMGSRHRMDSGSGAGMTEKETSW
ncbi:hypothetical protein [Inquilinus sp. CAU 1745]|uniref:hypothetical protein n=1 Tax=Inquilinus sp. CAU 1745 TaxID=3140369 RepID=UPI00325A6A4E